jgi:hypothetical protein
MAARGEPTNALLRLANQIENINRFAAAGSGGGSRPEAAPESSDLQA